jgi:hypothetical protein
MVLIFHIRLRVYGCQNVELVDWCRKWRYYLTCALSLYERYIVYVCLYIVIHIAHHIPPHHNVESEEGSCFVLHQTLLLFTIMYRRKKKNITGGRRKSRERTFFSVISVVQYNINN